MNLQLEENRFWWSSAQNLDYNQQCYIIYFKVAKRVDIKCSHYKKEMITMWHGGVKYIYLYILHSIIL